MFVLFSSSNKLIEVINMSFSNNKKVKLWAERISDAMPVVKKSKSLFSQDELKGKKYGMTVNTYIPDPGRTFEGLEANEDGVNEVEYSVKLDNIGNSCVIDSWDELTNIEAFDKEIVKPRAVKTAKEIQDKVIKDTFYRSAQVVVTTAGADFETLSEGAAKLREVAVAGNAVSFLSPTTQGKIAAGGLAKFIPDEEQKKIYHKAYLGEYAGASQIEVQGIPVIKTPTAAATLAVTFTTADGGLAPISTGTIANGVEGASIPFSAEGLKIVDVNGMETDQDFIVMADASGNFPELRITYPGQNCNNANAWVASGTTALTFAPMLATGTKYEVSQVRIDDALAFDNYKFGKIAGSEELGDETVDGVRVQVIRGGNVKSRTSMVRIDCPFAAGLPEVRQSVTLFIKK